MVESERATPPPKGSHGYPRTKLGSPTQLVPSRASQEVDRTCALFDRSTQSLATEDETRGQGSEAFVEAALDEEAVSSEIAGEYACNHPLIQFEEVDSEPTQPRESLGEVCIEHLRLGAAEDRCPGATLPARCFHGE
jgi:hypothetical protein